MAASADTEAPAEDTANQGFRRSFRKPLSSYRYSKWSGYLNAFREDPAGLLLAFSEDLESKGQPAVSLDFGLLYRPRYLFLHNASDVEYVLKDRTKNFMKSRIRRETFGLVLGDGLFFAGGEKHAKTRRVMQPAFEMSALDKFLFIMQEEARALADSWEEGLKSAPAGQPYVIEPESDVQKVTLDIVMRSMITRKVSGEAEWMKEMIEKCFRYTVKLSRTPMRKLRLLAGELGLSPSYTEFQQYLSELDTYVLNLVAERKRAMEAGEMEGVADDLMQMLQTARDAASGEGFSEKEIRDELVTMLLAGHDTTAVTMSWATLYLGMHPELADELAEEAHELLGPDGTKPLSMGTMRSMHKTQRFLRELMRMRPPVWEMQREVVRDEVLPSGAKVEAGRIILISPYVHHHKSSHFSDPDTFDPQRFVAEDGSDLNPTTPSGTPLVIPFGLGSRTCIGARFAEWELLALISTLCHRFTFKTAMKQEPSLLPLAILKPAQTISIELAMREKNK